MFSLDNSVVPRFFSQLVKWLQQWLPAKRVTKVRIVNRDPFRVTIGEWRADEELCRAAFNALNLDVVRKMVDCLRNSHLAGWTLAPDTPLDQRAIFGAKCEGYSLALNNLESLAVYAKPVEEIEATFAPENLEEVSIE